MSPLLAMVFSHAPGILGKQASDDSNCHGNGRQPTLTIGYFSVQARREWVELS